MFSIAGSFEQDAASVTADVLNAIHYLHSIGITHRDLKVSSAEAFVPFRDVWDSLLESDAG
jgi:serine/threonine protein kinase